MSASRLSRLSVSALVAGAWMASAASAQVTPNPTGTTPSVRPYAIPVYPLNALKINEVDFDPFGIDGGNEWVELYNSSKFPAKLKGIKLMNSAGVVLASLPDVQIPSGTYFVVHLGPEVTATMDNDYSDGDGNWFTKQPPGNYLGNTADGIYLKKAGKAYDAVFWGTGGPPRGAGYLEVTATNKWTAGDYVELAISSGHGRFEGSTLGRNINSRDKNTSADFMLDGGENGASPTPGTRNGLFIFSEWRAIHWVQAIVQEFTAIVGTANDMSVSVVAASHANVIVDDPDLDGGFSITADHAFSLIHNGAPQTLVGNLAFDYERDGTPGATSFMSHVSGTLTSPDGQVSLVLDYTKDEDGFHTLSHIVSCASQFTWTEGGQSYSYSANNTVTRTQTAQGAWTFSDNRSWTDWGLLRKSSTSTQTLTKTGDGRYDHVATQSQTAPSFPPRFGITQFDSGSEIMDYVASAVYDADFGFTKTVTRMDKEWVDSYGYSISKTELTKDGTFSSSRASGQYLSPLGTFDTLFDFTMRVGFPDPDPFDPGTPYQISDQLTRELIGTEFVEHGSISGPTGTMSYFIDAPMVAQEDGCGCGCAASGCNCGGPAEGEDEGITAGDVLGVGAGVGVAAGVCTWGTIATTPATLTGVGVLVPIGIGGLCGAAGGLWAYLWDEWD